MSYIDIYIPLIAGIIIILSPQSFVKPSDPSMEIKIKRIKMAGVGLVGVSILYGLVKFYQ